MMQILASIAAGSAIGLALGYAVKFVITGNLPGGRRLPGDEYGRYPDTVAGWVRVFRDDVNDGPGRSTPNRAERLNRLRTGKRRYKK